MILVVFYRATSVYHYAMASKLPRNQIPFDRPANYQINVQGHLDPTLSDLLGGMSIAQCAGEEDQPVTTLVGEMGDQAALAGVLNTLYELHLTVLLVKRLNVR